MCFPATLSFGNVMNRVVLASLEDDENTVSLDEDRLRSSEDFELMQYTGISDSKGVPIYEGDITNFGEVVWIEQSAAFRMNPSRANKDISFTESFQNYYDHPDLEVLGNIYEHPSLLSTKPEGDKGN